MSNVSGGSREGLQAVVLTIPRGRMRGDADGDGCFSAEDVELITDDAVGIGRPTKGTEDWYAYNVDGDNSISATDGLTVSRIVTGKETPGVYAEITGTWIQNPDHLTEEEQFYTDIPVAGMKSDAVVSLAVGPGSPENFLVRAEPIENALRVWVKLCPPVDIPCFALWMPEASGTVFIARESYATTELLLKRYLPIRKRLVFSVAGWNGDINQSVSMTGAEDHSRQYMAIEAANSASQNVIDTYGIKFSKKRGEVTATVTTADDPPTQACAVWATLYYYQEG